MAAEVPLETPWLAPQADVWDLETISSWSADNVKTPYVRDLLAGLVLGSIGPVAPEQSLLWAFHGRRRPQHHAEGRGGAGDRGRCTSSRPRSASNCERTQQNFCTLP
jgi:hypothetical protein